MLLKRKKKRSDEEIAEQRRRRNERSRIRRANETPEVRKKRLAKQRELRNTEEARLRNRESKRLQYRRRLQCEKYAWDAHRCRQLRQELWRLQIEGNAASCSEERPVPENLLMVSRFEFQERPESPVSEQECVESAVVTEQGAVVFKVLCGLCQRLCSDSDVQLANVQQSVLLARIYPGEDVTLFRICSKCRRSLSDNKVPLLARRCRIVDALVPVLLNPLNRESTNVDESCRPGSLLGTDNTVLMQVPTNCDDLNRILQPHAEVAAEIFSCCLTKSCSHNTAAALPSDETPKPIEIPEASGAWTQCSVWVSTRPIQAKPKRRTTAVQTEDEALRTGQNSGRTPCE
ncbi:uncharacterized protein LOC144142712 [Haemaphysalis longicornis]